MRYFILMIACLTLLVTSLNAQTVVFKVLDSQTQQPLIGVNILYEQSGTTTDIEGMAEVELSSFPAIVSFSYVGYKSRSLSIESVGREPQTISLEQESTALDIVTVTGSRYEQNIVKSAVSIDILKPSLLRSVNTTAADDVLNKVPGVQVIDGQANIRGGSGYSYGAGSRVMLLLDDVPALQPDAGFPNWNDLPIENLSQIEVLKGAASTLYGSAALNGIINFRSSYATAEPETRFSAATGIFLTPKDKNKKWWGDTTRYESNLTFVHKQKFGKLDFIGSGLFHRLEGFNQFTDEKRGRANVVLRYRYSDRLVFRLATLANVGESSAFFLWANPGSGAMKPLRGTVSDRKARRIYIDPSVQYTDSRGNLHKLLSRTMLVDNKNNTNQSNSSFNQYLEYQFQRKFKSWDAVLTSGVVGAWNQTNSQILGDTTFYGQNHAAYLQLDKAFGEKWTLATGARYEYIVQNSPENFMGVVIPGGQVTNGKMIGRFSANYQYMPYGSLRASFGQGYRYPTLTERFVTTTFGSFSIFANPSLRPETGWTSELGVKQGLSLGAFKGFLDVSAFVAEYTDMIEFTFVFEQNRIGFQPKNIGDTRISGIEGGIGGTAYIGPVPVQIFGGYTYIQPVYKNYDTSEEIRKSVSEPVNVLKYRSKHQLKMDVEASFWKWKWGVSIQRISHVTNVDKAFEKVPPIEIDLFGIGQYRDFNNSGYTLLDSRLSYQAGRITITALVNNLLNSEYTVRPALIEAPRNVALRVDVLLSKINMGNK